MKRLLTSPTVAGSLILQARLRARLTQRELAERAGTSQPTIAAYERGSKSPSLETLSRILRSAGFDLRMRLAPRDDHDDSLAAWRTTLSEEVREGFQRRQAQTIRNAKKNLEFT